MRVEEFMAKVSTTCEPDDTLLEAAQTMSGSNCGCLPVTTGDTPQRLVGMITDRDICTTASFEGRIDERTLSERQVKDAMAKQVRACNPRDSLVEVEALMREAHVPLLPVVDESQQFIGVISLTDVAHAAARADSQDPRRLGAHLGGVALQCTIS